MTRPAPVIVHVHGGGWVTSDLNTYDASDRPLAAGTGAIVVSVQYRLGPEDRFRPAAQDDADKACNWAMLNAPGIGGDSKRIALAGERAGGGLAIDTRSGPAARTCRCRSRSCWSIRWPAPT